ncbi:MAG: GNAT family N-acetyltransferase [Lachnospiraceae bacterium]|nr:GNAT family N-acetyltransferase [Lachnospiraceae bacterium]
MNITLIDDNNKEAFQPVLLKEVYPFINSEGEIFAIGLTESGTAIGALAGVMKNDRFQVLSLFVAPDYRRKGGGHLLVNEALKLIEEDADALEFSFAMTDPDKAALISFLEAEDFRNETIEDRNIYIIPLSDAKRAVSRWKDAMSARSLKIVLKHFSECNEHEIYDAEKQAKIQAAPMPKGGFSSEEIDADLSCLIMEKDELKAFCAVDYSVLEMPTIASLWVKSVNPLITGNILADVIKNLCEDFPPEAEFAVPVINDNSFRLVKKSFPNARGISYHFSKTAG